MNTFQALRVLNVSKGSSQNEIKSAYRRLALEHHPDKNKDKKQDEEFKKITEAYNHLKKNHTLNNNNSTADNGSAQTKSKTDFKKKPQWGSSNSTPGDQKIPEQDWGKYTKEFEDGDPNFWKEYERKFWEEYNARMDGPKDERKEGYERARDAKKQPDLFVDVDKTLCIGCCSCESIAPDVFQINKETMANPKSSVINQKGAKMNKIMNAAQTCPTKAISVDNTDTKERLYPY